MEFNSLIGMNKPVFTIAEIGQNHQGDISIAKRLIKIAKECGADCVKFQKTCLNEKFTKKALQRPYVSSNSWGTTYGEHKAFLEFSNEQFLELQYYARQHDILFSASAMDPVSLDFLVSIDVPFIKIGSGDANNFLLLEQAASKHIPLIISTGMQDLNTVRKIYRTVSKYHRNFALLHCVSAYPTPTEYVNLKVIDLYKQEFPDISIGYSGHEQEHAITTGAVALGASIIERHITLDKTLKGSDHKSSLEPFEFKAMINDINVLLTAFGKHEKKVEDCERNCYNKLRKSITASRKIKKGSTLRKEDLKIKVAEPLGIDGSLIDCVIGKQIIENIDEDESLTTDHVKLH